MTGQSEARSSRSIMGGWATICTLVWIVAATGAGWAQAPAPQQAPPPQAGPAKSEASQSGMDQAASEMAGHARLKDASRQRRLDTVQFVGGNMLFVVLHETGHTLISEMGLPVLGREEDAADAYATVTMLKLGTGFSYDTLADAAKGWFLSAERGQRRGEMLAFYDEHGLDWQRAYQIVCLMVGSDPDRFQQLADWVQMPEERQGTCQGDYSNASWSWDQVLKTHRRSGDQPKTKIEVVYREGTGNLAVYERSFRALGFLEAIADYNAENFVWRAPFTLEMQSCGNPDAHWDLQSRKLLICYELAEEFVQLYQDMRTDHVSAVTTAPNEMLARNIRRLRLEQGISMHDMAIKAGLDHDWCTRMEKGQETATPSQLEKLAQALHTKSDALIALGRSTETASRDSTPPPGP